MTTQLGAAEITAYHPPVSAAEPDPDHTTVLPADDAPELARRPDLSWRATTVGLPPVRFGPRRGDGASASEALPAETLKVTIERAVCAHCGDPFRAVDYEYQIGHLQRVVGVALCSRWCRRQHAARRPFAGRPVPWTPSLRVRVASGPPGAEVLDLTAEIADVASPPGSVWTRLRQHAREQWARMVDALRPLDLGDDYTHHDGGVR